MDRKVLAIILALLAAAFYAVNVPFSKILLDDVGPSMMSSLLYLGAGVSMTVVFAARRGSLKEKDLLHRSDLPYTLGMVFLDIAAPILLMYGISMTTSENVSLLNNFEIVATSVIAMVLFREKVSGRMWAAIILITVSSVVLTVDGGDGFTFNEGSLCVLGACVCWGLENNCTRAISSRSSAEIVMIKGLCSGCGCFVIALATGESVPDLSLVPVVMVLGFVSYGMSIFLYILAQRHIGAAKTSAYYSVAPFLGVAFAFVLFSEAPQPSFYVALVVMIAATCLAVRDTFESEDPPIVSEASDA